MTPTGYGDSPYQSCSTFAGNHYLIDLEALVEEGVLTRSECDSMDFGSREDDIDYDTDYDIEESLTPQPIVPVEEIPIVVEKKVEKKVTPTKEEAPQKEAQDDDIHLRTPQEARRAFIYAEIFNRKYD